jgi:RNA polymerase sigma-70 factor (ECF subfamily)
MSAVNICGEIEDDSGGCTLNYPGQPVEISTIPDQSEKSRFEKLFIPLLDNLYNMALRMTRNPNDAEDLVQETYLKAYKFFDSFRINTNARAWIMTIMMNTFRTGYRKSRKEPAKVDFEDVENFLPGDEDDLVKRPANKSELIRFRLPVLLSDAEQFNYQEISEILGINMGTVKSRIFRGRKLLKSSLFEFAVEKGICRRR